MAKFRVVVTGDARSRTSGNMQIMDALGLPVAGLKFPSARRRAIMVAEGVDFANPSKEHLGGVMKQTARERRQIKMNPKGFFEVPGLVMKGTHLVPDEMNGHAIKIIASGMIGTPFFNARRGTPPAAYDKAILAFRHPKTLATSQQRLYSGIEEYTPPVVRPKDMTEAQREAYADEQNERRWGSVEFLPDPNRFVQNTGTLVAWLADQPAAVVDKFLPVDFDATIDDPAATVDAITAHISYQPLPRQRQAAIDTITPGLSRSQPFPDWPVEFAEVGLLAERLYETLLSWTPASRQVWKMYLAEYVAEQMLEHVRWLDDEFLFNTMATVPPVQHRSFQTDNNGVKTYLLAERKAMKTPYIDACPHYSRDTPETYTVRVPLDIMGGEITRPKVACGRDGDLKIAEACKACWLRGWTTEANERREPQKSGGAIIDGGAG